jgi:hypothetical protein
MSFLHTILTDSNSVIEGIPLVDDGTSNICYILGKPSLPVHINSIIRGEDLGLYTYPKSEKIFPIIKKADIGWSGCLQSVEGAKKCLSLTASSTCVEKPYLPCLEVSRDSGDKPISYLITLISETWPICIYLPKDGDIKMLSTVQHTFVGHNNMTLSNFSQTVLSSDNLTFKYSLGPSEETKLVSCKDGKVSILD